MSYKPKKDYKFIKFVKSDKPNKKYYALLQNKKTLRLSKMYFGAIKQSGIPYPQYEDNVLGIYSKYNHYDKDRRKLYRKRHNKDINKAYSSSWFSLKFLW